jgi:3-oxoacyl-[acyl-carrier-protein] synthase III
MARAVYVVGSGTYLPGEPIAFEESESVLGELDDAPPRVRKWLRSSGPVMRELLDIKWVHYAIDPETREFRDDNVTMATQAAVKALEMAALEPGEVDLICYGSAHQDQMPTASVLIQEALGIERCDELSIHANCTSAYKALYLAHELVRNGRNSRALVLSSSIASSELRAEYYNQALLDKESLFLRWFLCDGAGAVVLSSEPDSRLPIEVEATYIESIGGSRPSLMWNDRPAMWLCPKEEYESGRHHLKQRFRNALASGLFEEAEGSVFFSGLRRMLEREGLDTSGVRYFQVNMPTRHIVSSIMDECEAIGIRRETLYSKLDELGYCGPPMALICLDKILREEPLGRGDRVLSFVTEVSKFMQAGYSVRHV